MRELAYEITREVTDYSKNYVVNKAPKRPFAYSKLAGILVTFKLLGESTSPETTFKFGYADITSEPYESLTDEL